MCVCVCVCVCLKLRPHVVQRESQKHPLTTFLSSFVNVKEADPSRADGLQGDSIGYLWTCKSCFHTAGGATVPKNWARITMCSTPSNTRRCVVIWIKVVKPWRYAPALTSSLHPFFNAFWFRSPFHHRTWCSKSLPSFCCYPVESLMLCLIVFPNAPPPQTLLVTFQPFTSGMHLLR